MTPVKEINLSCGGVLKYRLPNCLEQVRFYVDSKWNSKTYLYEQIEGAIPAIEKFIVEIKSEKFETFEEIINDRDNTNHLMDLCLDIAAQSLPEAKKKS